MATFNGFLFMSNAYLGTGVGDEINGGYYPDMLRGGDGRDTIDGGSGDDRLFGDSGNDLLFGGKGDDTIEGGIDNDTLVGGEGDDVLRGQDGNDTFRDAVGNNAMFGGDGIDTVDYSALSAGNRVVVNLDAGAARHEKIILGLTGTPGVTVERPETIDRDTLSSVENVTGSNGSDILIGSSGMNVIIGGKGDDTITGGDGADQLSGGAGRDTFVFGNGDANVRVTDLFSNVTVDRITDFDIRGGDRIDLSQIDANTNIDGNQGFFYANSFTGLAGQLLIRQDSDVNFRLIGDTNGDGVGDVFVDFTQVEAGWDPGNFRFYSDNNLPQHQATIWL